jgi:hypothetical protein
MEKIRKCSHCQNDFEPTRPNHHACSNRCKRREAERRRRKRRMIEGKDIDPTTFLRNQVSEPVEREGVPFPLTTRLPGSFEHGKKR